MRTLTRNLMTAMSIVMLAACAPRGSGVVTSEPNSYAPQPDDSSMMEGDIQVDSASIRLAESNPPQLFIDMAYFQPTPCYKLRIEVQAPDAQNRIGVHAYAVAEKDKPCALMALSTPLHASLSLGSYPNGHYTVWLNGSKLGEFDS